MSKALRVGTEPLTEDMVWGLVGAFRYDDRADTQHQDPFPERRGRSIIHVQQFYRQIGVGEMAISQMTGDAQTLYLAMKTL